MTGNPPLRAVEGEESRCVAISGDAWLGLQCELPAGHDGLHQCREFANGCTPPRRWKTGAPL